MKAFRGDYATDVDFKNFVREIEPPLTAPQ
jgi:hypothetical protein